ncbi:MAG: MCE family protein [Planctomycetes bacterium]|nr:MCE family protein [Planctomycetota bacterium]
MAFVRKSELVTGIFVLVGLLVGGALAIIPFNNFFSDSGKVQFVAYFDDVKLLQPKAQVAINGQPVGIVQSLEVVELDGAIPKESRIRVVFDVEDDVAKMLTKGTKTKIDSESMLGAKFVKILPDLTGVPLPKEGDLVLVETMPYADMFTTFDSLSEGIKPVFAGLQDTLSRLNNQILEPTKTQKIWDTVDSAKAMIDNLDARLAILTSQLTDADGLVPTAKLAIDDARSLLAKLESEIEILRKEAVATMGDARKALDNVDGGISELRESTLPKLDELLDETKTTVKGTGDKAQDTLRNVDGTLAKADTTLESATGLLTNPDLEATLWELRRTMQEMRLLVLTLKADPSQVIWGGSGEIHEAAPAATDKTASAISGRPGRYDD